MIEDESVKESELRDGKIGCLDCSKPFVAEDADTDMRFLDH